MSGDAALPDCSATEEKTTPTSLRRKQHARVSLGFLNFGLFSTQNASEVLPERKGRTCLHSQGKNFIRSLFYCSNFHFTKFPAGSSPIFGL